MPQPITKTVLLFAVFLFTLNANAQRYWDYVITTKGDSIRCNITYPVFSSGFNSSELPRYQNASMAKPKKITTDTIKEYFRATEQKLYKQVIEKNAKKPTFLAIIESGKINLYEKISVSNSYNSFTKTTTSSTLIEWYISKGNDTIRFLRSNSDGLSIGGRSKGERKKDLTDIIADNKDVYNKFIADNSFSLDEIRNIVHLYNTGEQFEDLGLPDLFTTDYIVTQKNDTIHGRVKNDFFKGYFTFKENNKSDYIKIDSSFTKEFIYSREKADLIQKTIPYLNTKTFVKWTVKGRVNLYEKTQKDDKGKIKYNWFISKDNGPLIAIKKEAKEGDDIRNHKGLLKNFMNAVADNKEIMTQYKQAIDDAENNSYFNSDEVVMRLINNYNYYYQKKQTENK